MERKNEIMEVSKGVFVIQPGPSVKQDKLLWELNIEKEAFNKMWKRRLKSL